MKRTPQSVLSGRCGEQKNGTKSQWENYRFRKRILLQHSFTTFLKWKGINE